MSSVGNSSSPVHCSRWSPSILHLYFRVGRPRQQSYQASGGIIPKSHARQSGKKWTTASALFRCLGIGSTVVRVSHGFPRLWSLGSRDSKCVGGELKTK
ncbi:hypothetical protein TNCV_4753141 [Trichonephila clavipes]|nr:hypothetical protein TNCV_4753141 [Trichonephila clavipes]